MLFKFSRVEKYEIINILLINLWIYLYGYIIFVIMFIKFSIILIEVSFYYFNWEIKYYLKTEMYLLNNINTEIV